MVNDIISRVFHIICKKRTNFEILYKDSGLASFLTICLKILFYVLTVNASYM